MSPEQGNTQSTDRPSNTAHKAWPAMRGGWSGWAPWSRDVQAYIDVKECSDARCLNVEVNVGYQGIDDGSVLSQSAGVGDDLRTAWKTKLEGEGKSSSGTSLRDTIFGSGKDVLSSGRDSGV